MAALLRDSIQTYTTPQDRWDIWNGGSPSAGVGRGGTPMMFLSNSTPTRQSFRQASSSVVHCGNRFKPSGSSNFAFLMLYDGNVLQCYVERGADGYLRLKTGAGTTLITSAATYTGTGTWFVDYTITFHPSAGSAQLYVDNILVGTVSGVNTVMAGASARATNVGVQAIGSNFFIQDLWVNDDSGTTNTTNLHDVAIDYFPVTTEVAAVSTIGGTSPAGSRVASLNQAPTPDGDTTYVAFSAAGRDRYRVSPGGLSAQVVSDVQVVAVLRKDDAGVNTFQIGLKNGTGETLGAVTAASASLAQARAMIESDPLDGSAITLGKLATPIEVVFDRVS